MTARNILIGRKKNSGFTLIELLVVLAIIALLAGLAAPVLVTALQKSKESALKQDLFILRKALDDFSADNDRYPKDLQELVDNKYIRNIPKDPVAEEKNSWQLIYETDEDGNSGISDIKSSAVGTSVDGENFTDW